MRCWSKVSAAGLFFAFTVCDAICQVGSSGESATQIGKQWRLGRPAADDPEMRDGSINDAGILEYLQQLAGRLAGTAGAPAMQVRLTKSRDQYASLLPKHVLYISAGLLDRIEDEAELAGLLAHELGHTLPGQQGSLPRDACVLASAVTPAVAASLRDREQLATTSAISNLKAAGYDPAGVLDLLSKLVYEHPAWAKAIPSEDLLALRVRLEGETMPPEGYRLDSSGFSHVHSTLEAMFGTTRSATAR
jgi:predicted Zn-dependent protease